MKHLKKIINFFIELQIEIEPIIINLLSIYYFLI